MIVCISLFSGTQGKKKKKKKRKEKPNGQRLVRVEAKAAYSPS
jgi:hypothetical protein